MGRAAMIDQDASAWVLDGNEAARDRMYDGMEELALMLRDNHAAAVSALRRAGRDD